MLFLNALPQRLDTGATPTFAGIYGSNGQSILGNSSGAWAIAANGTNRNITLTPSGTGYIRLDTKVLVGTSVDSGALFQIGTNTTTSAEGLVFGTDCFVYRSNPNAMTLLATAGLTLSGSGATLYFNTGAAYIGLSGTSVNIGAGSATALTLDASQNATFAGIIKPRLATTAGAPAYVKGAIYFDTTLNKLRVGGASAWETITSA